MASLDQPLPYVSQGADLGGVVLGAVVAMSTEDYEALIAGPALGAGIGFGAGLGIDMAHHGDETIFKAIATETAE